MGDADWHGAVLVLSGEHDTTTIGLLRSLIAWRPTDDLTVDLDAVTFCDSRTIAALLDVVRDGHHLTLLHTPTVVARVFAVLGLDQIERLTIHHQGTP